MAFSVRITGISRETGEAMFELEPSWWDTAVLMRDHRFIQSEQTRGYQDYDADLSVDETRSLHEQFLPKATAGAFGHCGWPEIIQRQVAALNAALRADDEFSHFHISVFEWESGLG